VKASGRDSLRLGDHFAARAMTDKGEALLRKAEGGAPLRDDQKTGMEEMNVLLTRRFPPKYPRIVSGPRW